LVNADSDNRDNSHYYSEGDGMKDKDPRLMTPEDLLESANKQVKYDELNKQIEEIIVANGKREASQLISDLIKDREQEAFEKGQADGRKQAYTKAIEEAEDKVIEAITEVVHESDAIIAAEEAFNKLRGKYEIPNNLR
jgi:flagellar biosynthesis/type III secretory pathway protein FliH